MFRILPSLLPARLGAGFLRRTAALGVLAVATTGLAAASPGDSSQPASFGPRCPSRPAFWQTRGNGFVLELQGPGYRMYEVTRDSLLPIGAGEVRDGQLLHQDAPVMPLRELLAMSDPLAGAPRRKLTNYTADPIAVFEQFWTTIDENYAFFDLLPRDTWRKQYALHRPQVRRDTTPEQLWSVFAEMIRPLNDGHTMLLDPGTGARAASRGPSPSAWMLDEAAPAYFGTLLGQLDSFDPATNILGNSAAFYGTLGGGRVGYLNVLAFEGFASTAASTGAASGSPRESRHGFASVLSRRGTPSAPAAPVPEAVFSILTSLSGYAAEAAPFAAALDRVFAEFASVDALILDLRFNQGGSGDLVVELANRLTARSRLAYRYRVRHGGPRDFEPAVAVTLEPHSPGLRGKPVIVLTSANTLSAGDLQALILRELPNVTLVGETTYGIFSEGIPRQIPLRLGTEIPGWALTVSTQRIHSARGEFLEQRGVSPDLEVHPDRTLITEAGRDNMLEAALELLAAMR